MSNPQAPGERSPAEPTMEEILASIRRIIADNGRPSENLSDEPAPEEASPPEPNSEAEAERPAAVSDPADPALVLTRMVAEGGSVLTVAPGELGQGEVIAIEDALLLTEPLPAEAARPAAASPTPPAAAPASPPAPRWVEPPSRAAAPHAAPAQPVPSQPTPPQPAPQAPPPAPPPSPPTRAGRTIEEITLEALEPMLRAWLDRHLREIVERRVQEEIDRISRKSES
jgi:cell pole-organizing protein PopZ